MTINNLNSLNDTTLLQDFTRNLNLFFNQRFSKQNKHAKYHPVCKIKY